MAFVLGWIGVEKLFQLGAISFPLPPGWRGALLAGSFTRFWRFTIEQPSRLFLSLAGFRACLLAGRR